MSRGGCISTVGAISTKKRHIDPSEAASRADASATHWPPRLLQADALDGFLCQGRASGRQPRPVPRPQRLRLDVLRALSTPCAGSRTPTTAKRAALNAQRSPTIIMPTSYALTAVTKTHHRTWRLARSTRINRAKCKRLAGGRARPQSPPRARHAASLATGGVPTRAPAAGPPAVAGHRSPATPAPYPTARRKSVLGSITDARAARPVDRRASGRWVGPMSRLLRHEHEQNFARVRSPSTSRAQPACEPPQTERSESKAG